MPTARQDLGVLPPYRRCEVDGVSLAFRQYGEGRDIVCLHAIGHGGGDFAAVVEAHVARYIHIDQIPPCLGNHAAHIDLLHARRATLSSAGRDAITPANGVGDEAAQYARALVKTQSELHVLRSVIVVSLERTLWTRGRQAVGRSGCNADHARQLRPRSAAIPVHTSWLVYPMRSGLCSSSRSKESIPQRSRLRSVAILR